MSDIDLNLEDDLKAEKAENVGDIIIENDDSPAEKPAAKKAEPPSIDEGAEVLKKQLEQERQRVLDAERRAEAAEAVAHNAQADIKDTQLKLVETAITTKNEEAANLKRQYSTALSNGDYEMAADIQLQMSRNAAELLNLENGKVAMENQARQPVQPRRGNEVDDFAAQMRSSGYPRSAEWVKNHPEYVTNPRMNQKMIAAHQIAIADGHAADTDGYFEAVERVLGIGGEERPASRQRQVDSDDDASASAAQAVSKRKAADESPPPSAPPSRNPPSNNGNRPQVVRLTAEEREMAAMAGLTEKEYALNKLALKREGRIN